jgi:hypothetical protein
MKIKEKDAQSRLHDLRESRNALASNAAQCLNSVKEFVTELPKLESGLGELRMVAGATELRLHTGTAPSDELGSFSFVAQRLLAQLDESAALIAELRPRLKTLAVGEK